MCVVEYVAYSRKFSGPVVASINVVMIGVGLVTISDVAVNFSGLLIALLSIVAAGAQTFLFHTVFLFPTFLLTCFCSHLSSDAQLLL